MGSTLRPVSQGSLSSLAFSRHRLVPFTQAGIDDGHHREGHVALSQRSFSFATIFKHRLGPAVGDGAGISQRPSCAAPPPESSTAFRSSEIASSYLLLCTRADPPARNAPGESSDPCRARGGTTGWPRRRGEQGPGRSPSSCCRRARWDRAPVLASSARWLRRSDPFSTGRSRTAHAWSTSSGSAGAPAGTGSRPTSSRDRIRS